MPAYVRIREKTVGGFEKKFDGIDTQTDRHSHLVYYSVVGAVVQLVEYRTRNRDVRLTPGPLQATLSKLLTYCVLRPTQPPTLSGTGHE